MSKSFIAIIIILIVALIGVTVFLFTTMGEKNTINQDLLKAETKNSQLTNDLASVTSEKDSLAQENDAADAQLTTLTAQLTTLTGENATLNGDLDKIKDQISDLQATQRSMEKKFMCSKTISSIDFTGNKSVNDALSKYVNQTKSITEPITANYWNIIWTGEKYSTHTIEAHSEKDRTNYLWTFTAYFRGEAYGDHENGVFYNDRQCWIYLDK
ncbi:MAG: hypothetical protein ACYDH2_10885 [Anaerolineaceae bacterium]